MLNFFYALAYAALAYAALDFPIEWCAVILVVGWRIENQLDHFSAASAAIFTVGKIESAKWMLVQQAQAEALAEHEAVAARAAQNN